VLLLLVSSLYAWLYFSFHVSLLPHFIDFSRMAAAAAKNLFY
jgi:hypothetical protein